LKSLLVSKEIGSERQIFLFLKTVHLNWVRKTALRKSLEELRWDRASA
jgi:hypothetical protein